MAAPSTPEKSCLSIAISEPAAVFPSLAISAAGGGDGDTDRCATDIPGKYAISVRAALCVAAIWCASIFSIEFACLGGGCDVGRSLHHAEALDQLQSLLGRAYGDRGWPFQGVDHRVPSTVCFVEGLAASLRAAATDPDNESQWCEIGSLHRRLGDSDAAEAAFRRPRAPLAECTIGLARLRAEAGELEASLDLCRERPSGSDDGELAALAECEGELLTAAADMSAAARAFTEAVWLRPYSALYRRELGQALEALGQTERSSIHRWLAAQLEPLPPR